MSDALIAAAKHISVLSQKSKGKHLCSLRFFLRVSSEMGRTCVDGNRYRHLLLRIGVLEVLIRTQHIDALTLASCRWAVQLGISAPAATGHKRSSRRTIFELESRFDDSKEAAVGT